MARRVTITPASTRALKAARLWLRQPGSGVNGARRWKALQDVPNRLRRHPYIGRVVEVNPAYRQLIVSGYVLIYRIDPDTGRAETAGDIEIVDVFGPGQEQNAP